MQQGTPSNSELLAILESEDFYRALRTKDINETDCLYIQSFISKTLTDVEWHDFLKHCLDSQIDPYKEMREIIYNTYARILKTETS